LAFFPLLRVRPASGNARAVDYGTKNQTAKNPGTSNEFVSVIENHERECGMEKGTIVFPDPADIAPENIAPIMAQMAAIQLSLAARLVSVTTEQSQEETDNLLTIEEAAERLKCSQDWLYKRARALPFTIRVGRNLRFSERGIEEAIRSGRRFS